jgi:hypothetical protein
VLARTRKPEYLKGSKNKTIEKAFSVEEIVVDVDRERRAKQKRQSILSFRPRREKSEEEKEKKEEKEL